MDDTDIIIIIVVVVVVCAIVLNKSQQKKKKSFSRKKEILRAFKVRSVIPLLSSTLVVSLSLSLFRAFRYFKYYSTCDLFGKIDVL